MKQEELAINIVLSADEKWSHSHFVIQKGKRKPKEDMLETINEALNVKSLCLSNKEHMSALDFVLTFFEYDNGMPITVRKENERYLLDLDNYIFDDSLKLGFKRKQT